MPEDRVPKWMQELRETLQMSGEWDRLVAALADRNWCFSEFFCNVMVGFMMNYNVRHHFPSTKSQWVVLLDQYMHSLHGVHSLDDTRQTIEEALATFQVAQRMVDAASMGQRNPFIRDFCSDCEKQIAETILLLNNYRDPAAMVLHVLDKCSPGAVREEARAKLITLLVTLLQDEEKMAKHREQQAAST
ncbi:MAG TPA: hypothetical protein VJC16_01945 [Candidatus Nanoarchaeia archaeon]|nr:hypothetical protein [Candidatus Nanoarchaeia archaeon]